MEKRMGTRIYMEKDSRWGKGTEMGRGDKKGEVRKMRGGGGWG